MLSGWEWSSNGPRSLTTSNVLPETDGYIHVAGTQRDSDVDATSAAMVLTAVTAHRTRRASHAAPHLQVMREDGVRILTLDRMKTPAVRSLQPSGRMKVAR